MTGWNSAIQKPVEGIVKSTHDRSRAHEMAAITAPTIRSTESRSQAIKHTIRQSPHFSQGDLGPLRDIDGAKGDNVCNRYLRSLKRPKNMCVLFGIEFRKHGQQVGHLDRESSPTHAA